METHEKQIANLLEIPLSLFMAFDRSKADGKVDVNDIAYFMAPLLKMPQTISESKDVLKSLKSLSPESRLSIGKNLKDQFDIADDVLEKKIEAGIDWILSTASLVGALK